MCQLESSHQRYCSSEPDGNHARPRSVPTEENLTRGDPKSVERFPHDEQVESCDEKNYDG